MASYVGIVAAVQYERYKCLQWAAMLSEVKLELGKGGQDPAFQCLCYFYDLVQKVWRKELVRGAPSFCLEFFGTHLR